MNRRIEPAEMVDLDRYPMAAPASAEGAAFVARCRREYLETGLCALPGFIRDDALAGLADEANSLEGEAYFCNSSHTPYLDAGAPELPDSDAANRREQTYVGSVAYDLIPPDSALRRLYLWDPLRDFIGGVLGKGTFHRFADPLGACSINVFVDGGEHGWHFDESEFTITLMLQPPRHGGHFEYVPLVRGRDDEKTIVASVLDGDRSRVVNLPFSPGTLLIFGGRQTLHRVCRVHGDRPRLVPVLCFSESPGARNSPEVRELFWGRTGEDDAAAR